MNPVKRMVVRVLRILNPLPEDVALVAELLTTHQRLTARLEQRIERVEHLLAGEEGPGAGLPPDVRVLVGTTLERLTDGSAEFLNWATGHRGYAAQAGLWLNPPIYVEHRAGGVVAAEMNERVVELPYAMAAAAELQVGSRVVDVGATESTLAITLASLGHEVTAVDPRPYPFSHPKLSVVTAPIEHWAPEDGSLDAVFCISTIEHIGIGAYDQPDAEDPDVSQRIIELFRKWLRPGGTLVLTVPYGRWSVSDFQRTYDAAHLGALLQGWNVLDKRICARTSALVWERMDGEPPDDARAVALLKARLP